MEDPAVTTSSEETLLKETFGRRRLLKAIAATGGAVAASTLLPGEWIKPVVEVGVLPAHAEISVTPIPTRTPTPEPEPATYSMLCDSEPGGGDIGLTDFMITQIQPRLAIVSGSGPLAGITATMTAAPDTGSTLPSFTPSLPRTAITDSSGRAHFPDLTVSGQPNQHFFLVFSFNTPAGPVGAECGVFDLPLD